MIFKIEVTGLDEVIRNLNNLAQKEMPFAISKGLNDTTAEIRTAEVRKMKEVFKEPTPYTLKSTYIRPANKTKLDAEVGVNDLAMKYLEPQIFGGPRAMKRSERYLQHFWSPGGGARLNKYGNISPGQITQVLSVLGRLPDKYSNISVRSRKRNLKPRDYFLLRTKHGKLTPGVWERKKSGVKPILAFIRGPQYKRRYPFVEVGIAVARQRLVANVRANISAAIQSSGLR